MDHPLMRACLIADPIAHFCVADRVNAGINLLPVKLRGNLSTNVKGAEEHKH